MFALVLRVDDSPHWLILGKSPTKRNLAVKVLFLVYELLLPTHPLGIKSRF